jgi:ribose-phosphate pyrophosphokinase
MGGSNRANTYAKFLKSEMVVCCKHREKANEVGKMMLIGDVTGKDIVIVDDMVDTAGTLTKAADLMIEQGATSVRAICTHGVLSANAYQRIDDSKLEELVITNTIPKTHKSIKVKEVSVADLFASTISSGLSNQSISDNFIC